MGQTPVRLPSRLRRAVRVAVAVRLPSSLLPAMVVVGGARSVAKISDRAHPSGVWPKGPNLLLGRRSGV